ncbi:MAG: OsmC family protein, partial [Candidatus Latescibacterota bacterium]
SGVSGANPAVTIDYTPPLGEGRGYTSLELLLMSLASCSGTSVVALLGRMRKTVSGFTVQAVGARREQHPTSLEKIHLKFVVTSGEVEDADIQKAIRLSEETYCPVWAMLKNNVEITTEHRIINS